MITEVLICDMLCATDYQPQAQALALEQPQVQQQPHAQQLPQAQQQPQAEDLGLLDLDAWGGQQQVALKPFKPDYGPGPDYEPVAEVMCKAHLMPSNVCILGMTIPTSGIYKGHQCSNCNHFYHNICTGDTASSNACVGM